MRTIQLHQVDAFTNQLFAGNPSGVVSNADGLNLEDMAHIAREMNLSETAFVLKPTTDNADMRLRFVTVSGDEVQFCGHATVGALHQLAQLNLFGLGKQGKNEVRIETGAGILNMDVTNEGGTALVSFKAPDVAMKPYRLQAEAFAEAFGIPTDLLHAQGTVLIDKKLNYIYVPAASLEQLGEQTFDFARIRQQFGKEGIVVFCFFTNQTISKDADLHARGLAPNVGIDEDLFTGSMQAGLVHAARQNGFINDIQETIITEQGNFVGRPGRARLTYDNKTENVLVTAEAVHVFSTKVEL
jgi:PhzF family phenazine biosynthesis protein